jgi:flagellar biosynthesis/type III secretory pathway protein FliH
VAFLTRLVSTPIVATQRVVKKRDFEKLVAIDATIDYANAEAKRIVSDAQASVDGIAELARRNAVLDGQAEVATQLAALAVQQKNLIEATLPLMARLVGEALSGVASDIDQEQRISHALNTLRQQLQGVAWLRLQVAPSNAAPTRRALAKSELIAASGLSADVVENASIGTDEFVLETDLGFATARVSEQLDLLKQLCVAALEHGVREISATGDDAAPSVEPIL